MLEGFLANAAAAGVEARAVTGAWPEASADVEPADVVVAGHVFYNIPELEPFARALDAHARRRVVVELTERHPLDWMRDLWRTVPRPRTARRAHGGRRRRGARAIWVSGWVAMNGSIAAASAAAGSRAARMRSHSVRKRLCLPADRDPEIAEALGGRLRERDGLWDVGPEERTVVTLWWDRA